MDKLKPSQLLRLGSQQVYQIKDNYFVTDETLNIVGACAVGMMAIGKLGTTSTKNCDHKDAVTEIELQLRGKHGIHSIDIFEANDTDSLTPEQIAQWLEERGA